MATQKKTAAAKSASKSATKNAAKKNTKSAAKSSAKKPNTKKTATWAELLELFEKLSVLPVPKKTAGEICVATLRLINAVQPLLNSAGAFVKVTVEDRT